MEKIKVGMLGIGNVGRGTWQALAMNHQKIMDTTGMDIEIVKILNRHPERDRGVQVPEGVYTPDVDDILEDPEIGIVVELIGGIEPATTYMARALENGKSVVTANKAAIAANGERLARIAQEHHVLLRFEAAVAGGIPILTSITTALLCNTFNDVEGILNGTTNYILTQMSEYGKSYEEVLKDAQAKGFAEADPTADVEGIDAANKLSILISLIFGIGVHPSEIPTKGITKVAADDIEFARENGYRIKLLATARQEEDKVYAKVGPVLVPERHPLASVQNEFNAVFLTGNAVDDLMFYGKGAGPLPTGSAVMGDVIGVGRKQEKDSAYDLVPQLRYDADLTFAGEGANRYYVRMSVLDAPGVVGKITMIFGLHEISIDTIIQRHSTNSNSYVPLLFIFQRTVKTDLDAALEEILRTKCARSIDTVMRVGEE